MYLLLIIFIIGYRSKEWVVKQLLFPFHFHARWVSLHQWPHQSWVGWQILMTSLFLVYNLHFYYLRCSGNDLFIWKVVIAFYVVSYYLTIWVTQIYNIFSVVNRRFVWIYAAIQFALVVVFAYIFYSLVRSCSNITNCLKIWFILVSVQPEINPYMSYILFHAMKRGEKGGGEEVRIRVFGIHLSPMLLNTCNWCYLN